MVHAVSVSIDVGDLEQAIAFYEAALSCLLVKKISTGWAVLVLGEIDIHLLEKQEGTIGAAEQERRYARHWTPVHLDFGVANVDAVSERVKRFGGSVEGIHKADIADIAHCADPFGNGFCLIREVI